MTKYKNSMVEANVSIIEELKYFLELVSKDPSVRKSVTLSETDFTRERKLTLKRVVGIIINMPKRSLSIEIQEFFESLDKGLESSSKGAFSLQRTKLHPLFFNTWNKLLVECFYHYYGELVRVTYIHPTATLPVLLRTGFVECVAWGRREKQRGGLPLGGWARLETVQAGYWDKWSPKPVKIPLVEFMARDSRGQVRWYDLSSSQWIQGLVAYNGKECRAYVVTIEPSTLFPEGTEFTHTRWPRIMHN